MKSCKSYKDIDIMADVRILRDLEYVSAAVFSQTDNSYYERKVNHLVEA